MREGDSVYMGITGAAEKSLYLAWMSRTGGADTLATTLPPRTRVRIHSPTALGGQCHRNLPPFRQSISGILTQALDPGASPPSPYFWYSSMSPPSPPTYPLFPSRQYFHQTPLGKSPKLDSAQGPRGRRRMSHGQKPQHTLGPLWTSFPVPPTPFYL